MTVPMSYNGSGAFGTNSKAADGSRKIDAEQVETLFEEYNKSKEARSSSPSSSRPSWFSRTYSKMNMRRGSKTPEQ